MQSHEWKWKFIVLLHRWTFNILHLSSTQMVFYLNWNTRMKSIVCMQSVKYLSLKPYTDAGYFLLMLQLVEYENCFQFLLIPGIKNQNKKKPHLFLFLITLLLWTNCFGIKKTTKILWFHDHQLETTIL